MKYRNGSSVRLGDVVRLPVPGGSAKARIVMLGATYEHLDIDEQFLMWVKRDKVLKPDAVVVEWIDANPFAHTDSKYAPVGNYMFSALDEWIERDA